MIWFRFTLTGIFLLAVIYFQFFFDFTALVDEELQPEQQEIVESNEPAKPKHMNMQRLED